MTGIVLYPDGNVQRDVWIEVVRNELGDADRFGIFLRNPIDPDRPALVETTEYHWYAEVLRDRWLAIDRSF